MSIGLSFPSVLEAARLGVEWAWSEVYRDLSPSVLRYLQAHGAVDAEDVLSETFVQVVRRLSGFHGGEDEFRAWVFAIARNQLIDHWRKRQRRPVEYLPDDALRGTPGTMDTEAEAFHRVASDRVSAGLAGLTLHQREVVYLRIIAGFSIEQVAKIVGKPPGAVKSLQARGLAALRKTISQEAVS